MAQLSQIKSTVRESFRMAIESIRQNKLRSILTLLGISIGVFSVIGVMTAIRTLESSVSSQLDVLGTNTFTINKSPAIQIHGPGGDKKIRKRKNITYAHYEEMKRRTVLPLRVSVIDETGERNIRYKGKTLKKSAQINGGDESALRSLNTYLADGRNFTPDDIRFARYVTILGPDVVDILFPFEDPLGKAVKIKGIDYTVIGVTERKGQAFGQSQDYFVIIPISLYILRFSNKWTSLRITFESKSAEMYDKTMDEAIGLMRVVRQVPVGEENDF